MEADGENLMKFFYKCSECGKSFEISPDVMVCPECSVKQKTNEPLRGVLEVCLDGSVGNEFDIFDLLRTRVQVGC